MQKHWLIEMIQCIYEDKRQQIRLKFSFVSHEIMSLSSLSFVFKH